MLGYVQNMTKLNHGNLIQNFIIRQRTIHQISSHGHGAEKQEKDLFVHFPSPFLHQIYIIYLTKTDVELTIISLYL